MKSNETININLSTLKTVIGLQDNAIRLYLLYCTNALERNTLEIKTSYSYCASELGVSKKTVYRARAILEKKGLIKVKICGCSEVHMIKIVHVWLSNLVDVNSIGVVKEPAKIKSPKKKRKGRLGPEFSKKHKKNSTISYKNTLIEPKKVKTNPDVKPIDSKLVNYWNSLPNVPKHRYGSKSYNIAHAYLEQLRTGRFDAERKGLKTYCEKHSIPFPVMRPIPYEKIKQILHEMSKLFDKNYWPRDKSLLPQGLSSLIYNRYGSKYPTSFFLYVMALGVSPLDERKSYVKLLEDEQVSEIFKMVHESEFSNDLDESSQESLIRNLSLIVKWLDNFPHNLHEEYNRDKKHEGIPFEESVYANLHDYWSSFHKNHGPVTLIKSYLDWLRSQFWLGTEDSSVAWFSPSSKVFKKFVSYYNDNFLYPEKIDMIKQCTIRDAVSHDVMEEDDELKYEIIYDEDNIPWHKYEDGECFLAMDDPREKELEKESEISLPDPLYDSLSDDLKEVYRQSM